MLQKSEIKLALWITWLIVSGIILAVLLVPFIVTAETIGAAVPECEWKSKYGRECAFCGMTHAFIFISGGRFEQALDANKFSVLLYCILVLNELVLLLLLAKRLAINRSVLFSRREISGASN
jgi:hypothetical protein